MRKSGYFFYEATHAMLAPARAFSDAFQLMYKNPLNPVSHTAMGRSLAAAFELFERTTRRYGKPAFSLPTTLINDKEVEITERFVWKNTFCNLLHFQRNLPASSKAQPKLLIVAPMSGHFATLLRGTVEAFLPTHDVYITDWVDARLAPLSAGKFDLDDYIDYVKDMLKHLGPGTNVLAVCQPSVPVAAAIARLEAEDAECIPASMILMGGPIDTRESPTEVNKLAQTRGIAWFRNHCISRVPFPHPGVGREVYPGYLQLSGFMAMNLDRHITAHWDMFNHLVDGDGDSAEKHRDFYDEYMAVMDLTAEFYLQTVNVVFVTHALPKGELTHRGLPVDLGAITRCALMTVEGEKDDISGVGQTKATHALCKSLPKDKHLYHLQTEVGHYGVFNGSRFRKFIAPKIVEFTYKHTGVPLENAGKVAQEAVAIAASSGKPVAGNLSAGNLSAGKPEVASSKPDMPKPAKRAPAKKSVARA